jgi:hypothetical protein
MMRQTQKIDGDNDQLKLNSVVDMIMIKIMILDEAEAKVGMRVERREGGNGEMGIIISSWETEVRSTGQIRDKVRGGDIVK